MADGAIQSGLRGVVAGATSLSSVGAGGDNLRYRGYDVEDLASRAIFEETAYLLLYGKLPTQAELDAYLTKLRGLRELSPAMKDVLERVPVDTHPMDVLRTAGGAGVNAIEFIAADRLLDAWHASPRAELR